MTEKDTLQPPKKWNNKFREKNSRFRIRETCDELVKRNLSHDEGDKIELICKNIRQQPDYDWTKVLFINYVPKLQSFNDCLVKNVINCNSSKITQLLNIRRKKKLRNWVCLFSKMAFFVMKSIFCLFWFLEQTIRFRRSKKPGILMEKSRIFWFRIGCLIWWTS